MGVDTRALVGGGRTLLRLKYHMYQSPCTETTALIFCPCLSECGGEPAAHMIGGIHSACTAHMAAGLGWEACAR